jgi:ABC-2 type transport system ATP-binding protein
MATVILENVSKIIKGVTVLDDIRMTLNAREITGLSGVNGSGKTMLMRVISGLIRPSSGRVMIDDRELWKDLSFPKSIGVLIENPAFLDDFSGFENLRILASVKKILTDDQIRETIRSVGLNPEDRKKYKKYSLGMKERLGIAAALMEHPDIILLDEPTNALDVQGVETIKGLLRTEKERGALIVISCHDVNVLKELSDRIYQIEEGKITDCFDVKSEGAAK